MAVGAEPSVPAPGTFCANCPGVLLPEPSGPSKTDRAIRRGGPRPPALSRPVLSSMVRGAPRRRPYTTSAHRKRSVASENTCTTPCVSTTALGAESAFPSSAAVRGCSTSRWKRCKSSHGASRRFPSRRRPARRSRARRPSAPTRLHYPSQLEGGDVPVSVRRIAPRTPGGRFLPIHVLGSRWGSTRCLRNDGGMGCLRRGQGRDAGRHAPVAQTS